MPLVVSLNTKQLDRYSKALGRISRDLPRAVDNAVNLTANEGKTFITPKTPIITGNLRRGFQVLRLGLMRWRIFNLVEYFMFIETGERIGKFGNKIRRRAGAAKMLQNSVKQVGNRLSRNVTRALRLLLVRRS